MTTVPTEFPKLRDDRGRSLSRAFIEDLDDLGTDQVLPEATSQRIRRRATDRSLLLQPHSPRKLWITLIPWGAAFAIDASLRFSGWNWWGWPCLGQSAVYMLAASTTVYFIRLLPPRSHIRLVRAIIDEGHCAGCGYLLSDLEPEPDGCTVCPECGAAWELPVPAASNNTSTPT